MRSQGQSCQAIKLFQITPYVNDFQTLNSPGSQQFRFLTACRRLEKLVLPSIFDTNLSYLMTRNSHSYMTTVLNERMWHFRGGVKTYSDPSYIFSRGQDPQTHRIYAPVWISWQQEMVEVAVVTTGSAKTRKVPFKLPSPTNNTVFYRPTVSMHRGRW